jgi:methyl-accepting chemotaxis protein PixJ
MMTAQFQEALQAYVEGRYDEAMREFSQLLTEDPRNPTLLIWLGATLRKAGKIDYAKLQYQQVLTLTDDPDLLELAQTSLTQIQKQTSRDCSANNQTTDDEITIGNADWANIAQNGKNIQLVQSNNLNNNNVQLSNPNNNQPNNSVQHQGVEDRVSVEPANLVPIQIEHFDDRMTLAKAVPNNLRANHEGMGTVTKPQLNGQMKNTMTTSSESATRSTDITIPTDITPIDVGFVNTHPIPLPPPLPMLAKKTLKPKKAAVPKLFKSEPPVRSQLPKTNPADPTNQLAIDTPSVSPAPLEDFGQELLAQKFDQNFDSKNSDKSFDKSVAFAAPDEDIETFKERASNLKFSTIKLKITAWAIALATIPAIAIGATIYHKGSTNFSDQVKQTKAVEVTSLADTLSRFMLEQHKTVSMLGLLFGSAETNKPAQPLAPAQQKQALTNRLNLYKQAYVSFDSIAIFDLTGKQLAQSAGTPTPHNLDKDFLKQVVAANSLLIGKPFLADQEYAINFAVPIKDPTTQKVTTILQARMPLKVLLEDLKATGVSNFSVIDTAGKYVVGTDAVQTGTDATADFMNLPEVRSNFHSKGTIATERGAKLLAYAPTPKFAATSLDWDVLSSTDKKAVLAPNQLLLLLAAIGVGLTPLLVGAVAYTLSNQLSIRLKSINGAVRQITKGKLRTRVLIDGNDELAELSLSINKMTEEFQVTLKNHRQDNERLQNQVMRLFKTLVQLAKIDEKSVEISDQSIGAIVNRVQSQIARKDSDILQLQQEKELFHKQLMQIVAEVKDLSQGDLTVSAQMVEGGDISEISTFFNTVIENLSQIVTHVKTAAAQVNQSLGHNQQAITHLSDEALKQAEQISRTLNAVQMMNVSAQTSAKQSNQVTEIAEQTAQTIQAGNQAADLTMQGILKLRSTVTATAKKVKRLGESSQQISKVVSLIDDIAVQTNFLSINASLEAARAGESGKGFALVAEEVGTLAARSAAAIKEVEQLIGNIQAETSEVMIAMELGTSQVAEGTQLVEDVQKSLQQIAHVSRQIDELVGSISDATGSQALTSECIANLMKDISQVSGRTVNSSTKVSKSLQTSVKLAEQLQKSVDRFKVS